MAKEYDCYVRFLRTDIEEREGDQVKLIVRDYEHYISHPVTARIYSSWREGLEKLYIRDPLGRLYKDDPWGIEILSEEDQERLLDPDYQKCMTI
jgi:hypothetical protein